MAKKNELDKQTTKEDEQATAKAEAEQAAAAKVEGTTDGQAAKAEQAVKQSKFAEKAKELFGAYPEVNTLYFTFDGYAFKTENDARNHARTLKEKCIETLERKVQ
jgi:hypothetical protein